MMSKDGAGCGVRVPGATSFVLTSDVGINNARASHAAWTSTHVMKIHIAHSPDSDDAFMFYGLATGKVPSHGYELQHVLSDIETLNRAAFDGKYEITAVSFHAYAHLTDKYILLP